MVPFLPFPAERLDRIDANATTKIAITTERARVPVSGVTSSVLDRQVAGVPLQHAAGQVADVNEPGLAQDGRRRR